METVRVLKSLKIKVKDKARCGLTELGQNPSQHNTNDSEAQTSQFLTALFSFKV